jgi:hypothetical protein
MSFIFCAFSQFFIRRALREKNYNLSRNSYKVAVRLGQMQTKIKCALKRLVYTAILNLIKISLVVSGIRYTESHPILQTRSYMQVLRLSRL